MITARATIVTTATATATARGIATARAAASGLLPAGRASARGLMTASGTRSRERNLLKFLAVVPQEPQHLVWLTPQVGVDYRIESNTEWRIT